MSCAPEHTIDTLARAAGTTVRSVRVYHERGVLPPPQVRGRTGYYGPEHVTRLRAIGHLLDRGMKLNGIKELFDAHDRGDDLADLLGGLTPFPIEVITAADLSVRCRDVPDWPERLTALGLIEAIDDTTYRVVNPRLRHYAAQLAETGVTPADALTELERLAAECAEFARRFRNPLRPNESGDRTRPTPLARAIGELVDRALRAPDP